VTFKPFFDVDLGQEILEVTGGVLVEYRGRRVRMHCEEPTIEVLNAFANRVQGIARVLIGQRSCLPNLERGKLITVAGEDWVVGDFGHPGDGEEVIIALTHSTRA
jgi:hypothetical protein